MSECSIVILDLAQTQFTVDKSIQHWVQNIQMQRISSFIEQLASQSLLILYKTKKLHHETVTVDRKQTCYNGKYIITDLFV